MDEGLTSERQQMNQLARLAARMVSGETGLIEGCRQLVALDPQLNGDVERSFNVIRAVDSETDSYPVSVLERASLSAESLAAADRDLAAYLDRVRPVLLEACKDLVAALGPIETDH